MREEPEKISSPKFGSKENDFGQFGAGDTQDKYAPFNSQYSRKTVKSISSAKSGRSGKSGSIGYSVEMDPIKRNLMMHATALSKPVGTAQSRGADDAASQAEYNIPTIKLLNPELYKENLKQARVVKDQTFESVSHLKERYSYHELRQQRVQKRTEDITKELEQVHEEAMMKSRKKRFNR